MAKKVKLNPYRIGLQLVVWLLLAYMVLRPFVDKSYIADFEAYCPFGGLQAFSSFMVNNSLACSMTTTQIFMGIALLAGVVLMSKLFCSHLCPIGSFTEWLGRMGRKFKLNVEIKGIADRLFRIVKYALLFITFYFSVTSSELFCKTFDPYYAVFSGLSSDVVLSYAIMTLFIAIPGSFFFRQFWCRYVCPLGAISNIFTHSYIFIGVTGIFILLTTVFNVSLHWLWLLGVLTVLGLLLEVFKVRIKGFSAFKITRNPVSCTNCRLCDKACPMSLDISKVNQVQDIDCHLCGDCVASCPETNVLKITRFSPFAKENLSVIHHSESISAHDSSSDSKIMIKGDSFNKRKRSLLWVPAAAVIGLVIIGLGFADKVDIPTISLKWGDDMQMNQAGIYEQEGLASIKCFGSSMSFANHMRELNGVLGVETFVSDKSIKVYYDKAIIGASDIKKAIFTPVKKLFISPDQSYTRVNVVEAAIDQFFDPNDAMLLSTRFSQNDGILAMQTTFGEPVHAIIYYDNRKVSSHEIKEMIEARRVQWESGGELYDEKTDFKVASMSVLEPMNLKDYLTLMYEEVSMTFNEFETYQSGEIDTVIFDFPQAADPELVEMPWYLLSHISLNRSIVGFEIIPEETGFKLSLKIVKGRTDKEIIKRELNKSNLVVHLSDGSVQSVPNPYKF